MRLSAIFLCALLVGCGERAPRYQLDRDGALILVFDKQTGRLWMFIPEKQDWKLMPDLPQVQDKK